MRLIPDLILGSYEELTPEFLLSKDIHAIILDVDNTLIPYEVTDPPADVRLWLSRMSEAGIRISFVTNNHKPRLLRFNKDLGYPAYANSGKPFLRNMKKALYEMQADPLHTANMGDQIFTDVWAGKRMRLFTILVSPIKDKKDLFTRCKRLLERPIKKAYRKEKESK